MKRVYFILPILMVLFVSASFAQTSRASKKVDDQAQQVTLKPTFQAGDIVFALQAMNAVEIQGSEVETFLLCKTWLTDNIKKAQEAKKIASDPMPVEIQLNVAQAMVAFLERAKIPAANAEQYKRFIDSIVESAKDLKK